LKRSHGRSNATPLPPATSRDGSKNGLAGLTRQVDDQRRMIATLEAQLTRLRGESARADTARSYPTDTEIRVRCARSKA
jgi:hypothetical protein